MYTLRNRRKALCKTYKRPENTKGIENWTEGPGDQKSSGWIDRLIGRQMDRKDRWVDGQIDRQLNRWIE